MGIASRAHGRAQRGHGLGDATSPQRALGDEGLGLDDQRQVIERGRGRLEGLDQRLGFSEPAHPSERAGPAELLVDRQDGLALARLAGQGMRGLGQARIFADGELGQVLEQLDGSQARAGGDQDLDDRRDLPALPLEAARAQIEHRVRLGPEHARRLARAALAGEPVRPPGGERLVDDPRGCVGVRLARIRGSQRATIRVVPDSGEQGLVELAHAGRRIGAEQSDGWAGWLYATLVLGMAIAALVVVGILRQNR